MVVLQKLMCVLCAIASASYDAARLDETRAAAVETKRLVGSREEKMLPVASASARDPAESHARHCGRLAASFCDAAWKKEPRATAASQPSVHTIMAAVLSTARSCAATERSA